MQLGEYVRVVVYAFEWKVTYGGGDMDILRLEGRGAPAPNSMMVGAGSGNNPGPALRTVSDMRMRFP